MIQELYFPGRTRHQIKLKFKKEERQNPLRINEAVLSRSTCSTGQSLIYYLFTVLIFPLRTYPRPLIAHLFYSCMNSI